MTDAEREKRARWAAATLRRWAAMSKGTSEGRELARVARDFDSYVNCLRSHRRWKVRRG